MKNILFSALIIILISVLSGFKTSSSFEPVAVVELFTSQGCSSCPAADRLLSQTIAEAKKDNKKVIALSFHVDYWNRLGWADPFSDKKYSKHQREYATALNLNTVYTPQVIVNGETEFVGSGENEMHAAINNFLNKKTVAGFKNLSATVEQGKPIRINYSIEGNYNDCKINFALLSLSETTSIKRGENGGRILKNENVVRQFITQPAAATGDVSFELSPMPAKGNFAIVAYLQRIKDLKIIGAEIATIH